MNITEAQLEQQYQHAKTMGWIPFFKNCGYNIEPSTMMGVASRETNMRSILGDGGHGHGICQIDDRSWPEFCKSGKWQDVQACIQFGAMVLRMYCNKAQKDGVKDEQLSRTALAMYNAGARAERKELDGFNPDLATTGLDYGHDVLYRAAIFKRLLDNDQ